NTPTRTTSTPALASPATTAASSISPLARGSRPTTATGRLPDSACRNTRAAAIATDMASSGPRSPLASPRTPSVPKSRAMCGPFVARLLRPRTPALRLRSLGRGDTTAGPTRGQARPCVRDEVLGDQRFEYWGALRAFFRPYFLLSLTRGSRV